MFESTASRTNPVRALVNLSLKDGSAANYAVRLPLSSKLADALNNADQFLDVVDHQGKQSFLAKREVRRVELIDVPRANQLNLNRRHGDQSHFDPHEVLGIAKGADAAQIKAAYHAMARQYHPDRFANLDLPKEMHGYAAAMLVRINLAYEQLSA